MSFSARQQHCLEAMGIVPWVSKQTQAADELLLPVAAATPVLEGQAPVPAVPTDGSSAGSVDQGTTALSGQQDAHAMPSDLQALSHWLPNQSLAPFLAAGKTRNVIGPEDASLLVIVEAGNGTGQQPLEGDAARLFEMMMRAIKLSRQQLRICTLSNDAGSSSAEITAIQPTVRDVCNPQTKAILLLQNDWHTNDDLATTQDDTVRLESPPCPLWRIPHPDVLLRRNQLKRQAWQSLQALQRVL